jgi:2-polyprenyl-3-methyl-5-hydroxy-6-metoxy-1,4-benzoquinol methylase
MTHDPRNVDGRRETARFNRLGFDSFRDLAIDPKLSENEKIGCATGHREGFGEAIWTAIMAALPALGGRQARVLDIGPGCAELPRRMIALAEANGHQVTMIDHREMLDQLPVSVAVTRVAGRFPEDMPRIDQADEGFDVVLAYGVLQSVIIDGNPSFFIDAALDRLRPGGRLLIGDVPNFSKLRRFLTSDAGVAHHYAYMRTDQAPEVPAFAAATDRIDDGMLLGFVLRARLAGYDAYLLPQPADLPLANRREDLLIVRP